MGDWALAGVTIIGAAIYLYFATQLPPGGLDDIGPGAFPTIIGAGLLLAGFLLVFETLRKQRAAAVAAGTAMPPDREGRRHQFILIGMLAWTAVYYYAFEPVGYLIATVLFLFPMLAYFNRNRWITNALVAIGFTLVAYVLFAKVLKVVLPAGLWGF
jgi:putative tricarboxylic transport membrane protein